MSYILDDISLDDDGKAAAGAELQKRRGGGEVDEEEVPTMVSRTVSSIGTVVSYETTNCTSYPTNNRISYPSTYHKPNKNKDEVLDHDVEEGDYNDQYEQVGVPPPSPPTAAVGDRHPGQRMMNPQRNSSNHTRRESVDPPTLNADAVRSRQRQMPTLLSAASMASVDPPQSRSSEIRQEPPSSSAASLNEAASALLGALQDVQKLREGESLREILSQVSLPRHMSTNTSISGMASEGASQLLRNSQTTSPDAPSSSPNLDEKEALLSEAIEYIQELEQKQQHQGSTSICTGTDSCSTRRSADLKARMMQLGAGQQQSSFNNNKQQQQQQQQQQPLLATQECSGPPNEFVGSDEGQLPPFSLVLGPFIPGTPEPNGDENKNLLKPMDDDEYEEEKENFGGGTTRALTAASNSVVGLGIDYETGEKYVEMCFNRDTFSFFITSQICSLPWLNALFVFSMQIAFFILVGTDMLDFEDPDNVFKMPANVSTTVRVTQLLAMVVAVMTQGDMLISFDQMRDGYCYGMTIAFEHATRCKFWFSVSLRFIEGAFGLLVSFFLIVTSETVIDLLLNFTALEFVSTYDDAFFYLAEKGFLGRKNEIEADLVEKTTYRAPMKTFRRAGKFGLMLSFVFALLGGFLAITIKQNDGQYVSQHLQVQFGDELIPALGTFSGIYDRKIDALFDSKYVTYADRQSSKAWFSYCDEINAWTFRYEEPGMDSSDPCEWIARSEETLAFDIIDTASLTWYIRDKNKREVILDPFTLLRADCKNTDNECMGRGSCSNGVCSCDSGWFGNRCEFLEPCLTLALDASNAGFSGAREWPRTYEILKNEDASVIVYGRPTYMYKDSETLYFIIVFTGRRWILTSTNFFPKLNDDLKNAEIENGGNDVLADYFQNQFHAHWSDFSVGYVTEPMDVRTPIDANSPGNLKWFVAEVRDASVSHIQAPDSALPEEDAVFLCSTCDNVTNPCQYDGVCQNDGNCECAFGAYGELCEVPPIGNGKCDSFYNRERYEFDGGDCCESTCVSAEIQCGMWESTYVNYGYPECKLPIDKWYHHGTILGQEPGSWSGYTVALSNEGNILAVGEYGGIRVFDKDGSRWIFRANIPMPADTNGKTVLPYRIRLTQLDDSVTSNPSTLPPIRVSVLIGSGLDEQTDQAIYVYECDSRCDVGEREVFTAKLGHVGLAPNLTVFDMSTSGEALAIVSRDAGEDHGNIEVHDLAGRTLGLRDTLDVTGALDVRLSHNGDRLAVLVLDELHWYIENFFWTGSGYVPLGKKISVQAANTFAPVALSGLDGYSTFALAGNGQVLAIAPCETPRHIHVYQLEGGDWIPRGSPSINGIACDTDGGIAEFLTYIALSADGSELAFGGKTHDPAGDGTTDVFRWTGREWVVLGRSFPGVLYGELALSDDGTAIAMGDLYGGTGATGLTNIYTSPEPFTCSDDDSLVRVSFTDDGSCFFGCGWVLMNHKTKEVVVQSKKVAPEDVETVVHEVCLDVQHECFSFVVVKNGEAFDTPSAYGVFVDAVQVASDSLDGKSVARDLFGNCPDSNLTTFFKECEEEGESSYQLSVMLDMFPSETAWTLVQNKTDSPPESQMVEGPFQDKNRLNVLEEAGCWNIEENCYILTLYDSHGVGLRLSEFSSLKNSHGASLTEEHAFEGEFFARRLYLGDCPVCPEGEDRFEAQIRSCEMTEWRLTTTVNAVEEVVLSGGNGAQFQGENSTAHCQYTPAEDFRAEAAAYGKIFYEAEAYWIDACLDMSYCYEFSVLEGETTRFSISVNDEEATEQHHHNKLMESSISFGNCGFNPFE